MGKAKVFSLTSVEAEHDYNVYFECVSLDNILVSLPSGNVFNSNYIVRNLNLE